jgi:hypothetical protein
MNDDDTSWRDDILRGVPQIAKYAGQSEQQTYFQLSKGRLPAWKVGKIWVSTKTAIRRRLLGEDQEAA